MTKIILGGGLSGLSAAYYLLKKPHPHNICIIEASSRTGGWVKSTKRDGILFEQGPRTIRPRGEAGANTLQMIEDLNLADQIVTIPSNHPAARNRLIYAKNGLHLLPSSIKSLFERRQPFTKPLILQLLNDLKAQPKIVEDESIYEFVCRRFGVEVADYLISPLICGICAGNAKEISVNFLMKQLFDYEQKYGSISMGLLRNLFRNKQPQKTVSDLVERSKSEKWNVYSFTNGCETLPLTLTNKLIDNNVKIHLNSACSRIEFNDNKIDLFINDNRLQADHLISSLSASKLSKLLHHQHPELAQLLDKIRNVSVAVVNLFYNENHIKNEAFGFLVAPKENLPILGVIYDSCCFPNSKGTILTAMMGGFWFEQYFGSNPDKEFLLKVALENIEKILQIKSKPTEYKVNLLKNCIPQYTVGHNENVAKIEKYIGTHRLPLSLCGASYYGVGVNDVILSAKKAVEKLS